VVTPWLDASSPGQMERDLWGSCPKQEPLPFFFLRTQLWETRSLIPNHFIAGARSDSCGSLPNPPSSALRQKVPASRYLFSGLTRQLS
jgi:hypothetical protein